MQEIKIQRASPCHAEQIIDVHLKSWITTYSKFFEKEVFEAREQVREQRVEQKKIQIENSDHTFNLVALSGKKVVGFLTYTLNNNYKEFEQFPIINALYLLKEYQKQGVGTRLLRTACNELATLGAEFVLVGVLNGNSAEEFYQKFGGEKIFVDQAKIGTKTFDEIFYSIDLKKFSKPKNRKQINLILPNK